MGKFSRKFELRWSDADANGHIRHTVYAELGAEVRMAFLREAGFDWKAFTAAGIGPVLLREELQYFREIALGEDVVIDVVAAALSPDGARWILRHEVQKDGGERAGRVVVTGGWIDLAARRLTVPPEALTRHMASLERADDFRELPPLGRGPDGGKVA